MTALVEFCERHGLKLIEDCCDALGSKYGQKHLGTYGQAATYSFIPPTKSQPEREALLRQIIQKLKEDWNPSEIGVEIVVRTRQR